jgi:aminoglycoside phosphotransferase (APT) family kinase protein
MPAAEIDVDERLVRRLLAAQHPDLAELPLAELAFGWDNVIYRLGEELTVRLPRRAVAAVLVEHEQRWLPRLPPLPLPIPVPLHTGGPGTGYPWPWSICPWLPGDVAATSPPADPFAAATDLGRFVRALHRPAPPDAPHNPVRGIPLPARSEVFAQHLARLGDHVDVAAVAEEWHRLAATPAWTGPPLWLHGDLHAANVLVHEGAVSAVIDFGDVTAGDPATDLAVAWVMLPSEARDVFRAAAGDPDDDTWDRARGWALALAVACLANSAANPLIGAMGQRTLEAVLSS